jgi:hypothetical protein
MRHYKPQRVYFPHFSLRFIGISESTTSADTLCTKQGHSLIFERVIMACVRYLMEVFIDGERTLFHSFISKTKRDFGVAQKLIININLS